MSIRDLYIPAIRAVMADTGIQPAEAQPSPAVQPGASLADALQYTDWYATERGNGEEHYRFDRYRRVINRAPINRGDKWAHIDVGCGAGLFSWAFLDWAANRGVECSNVTLHGYDACAEMIRLAWMLRAKISPDASCYPDLHYGDNIDAFIRKLGSKRIDADCLITFGYVLAGNHNDDDLSEFMRITVTVVDTTLPGRNVYLLASDATSAQRLGQFEEGWGNLLSALQTRGVRNQPLRLLTGFSGDRGVLLSRQEAQR